MDSLHISEKRDNPTNPIDSASGSAARCRGARKPGSKEARQQGRKTDTYKCSAAPAPSSKHIVLATVLLLHDHFLVLPLGEVFVVLREPVALNLLHVVLQDLGLRLLSHLRDILQLRIVTVQAAVATSVVEE